MHCRRQHWLVHEGTQCPTPKPPVKYMYLHSLTREASWHPPISEAWLMSDKRPSEDNKRELVHMSIRMP